MTRRRVGLVPLLVMLCLTGCASKQHTQPPQTDSAVVCAETFPQVTLEGRTTVGQIRRVGPGSVPGAEGNFAPMKDDERVAVCLVDNGRPQISHYDVFAVARGGSPPVLLWGQGSANAFLVPLPYARTLPQSWVAVVRDG